MSRFTWEKIEVPSPVFTVLPGNSQYQLASNVKVDSLHTVKLLQLTLSRTETSLSYQPNNPLLFTNNCNLESQFAQEDKQEGEEAKFLRLNSINN